MLIVSNYNVQPECVLAFDGNTTKNVYSGTWLKNPKNFTKKTSILVIFIYYVHGRYHLLKGSFDDFLKYFSKVRLIKLNKENWLLSTCNCSWFLKNYYCYHLIAIASNSGLIVIPIEYKDLAIGHKPIRGRKRLAKSALEKNLD